MINKLKQIINTWAAATGRTILWDGVDFMVEVRQGEDDFRVSCELRRFVFNTDVQVFDGRFLTYKSTSSEGLLFFVTCA